MSCETVVYIDWFYLCHMDIQIFTQTLIDLALDRHVHLTRQLPVNCLHRVPNTVLNLLNEDCEDTLAFINSELLTDIDFLHDMHTKTSLYMYVDDILLSKVQKKHPTDKIYILCPVLEKALELLSVTYLALGQTPKAVVTDTSVRKFLANKAIDKKVVLYTEAYSHTFMPRTIE